MNTCTHDRSRVIEETGFCFGCWHDARETARHLRRVDLETALRSGRIVWQAGTFWSTAGVILTRFPPARADAIFIEPYASDPVYLADHLENREHGFGFETLILRTEVDQ